MNKLMNIIAGGIVALSFSSCASNLSSPVKASSILASVSSDERSIAEHVYSLVNQERTLAGKSAMRGHGGLNKLAQMHSDYMGSVSKDANHFGSHNRAQYAYLKYNIENLSEMTYAVPNGSGNAAVAAVSAWKSSAAHHKHMLQSWDLTGVGVKTSSDGTIYVTICMGARPSGMPRSIQPIGWQ